MSYQQPPDDRADAPGGLPPPGWYPMAGGLQLLRWWDGRRWWNQTRPLPGYQPESQPQFRDAAGGYDAFRQESSGQYPQQSSPQGGAAQLPGMGSGAYPASFPAAQPQKPDPVQSQEPRVRPGQSPYPGPPQQLPLDGYPPHPGIGQSPDSAQPVQRRRHRKRRLVLTAGGTLVVLIAVLIAVRMTGGHNQKAASASLSRASSASPDCQSLAAAWEPGGEKHQQAFSAALDKVESDDNQLTSDIEAGNSLTADTNTLAGNLGSLEGAVYNIKFDLPPSCIPGFAHDYGSAMDGYSNYDIYQILAIGALNKGNSADAQTDLALATASEAAGNSAMQSALDDLNAFNASGS